MDLQGIATVLTAVTALVVAILNFAKTSYDKRKEYEIRKQEKEDEISRTQREKKERNEIKKASQVIYRELNRVFNNTNSLRAYIIQPHPLDKAKYISVQYEVLGEGMTSVLEQVQRMPIGNIAGFVAELSSRDFVLWNTQKDVKDDRARAMMHDFGTDRMAAMRMMDNEVWLGNIVLDFDDSRQLEAVWLKEKMGEVANIIKYKLPEIEED